MSIWRGVRLMVGGWGFGLDGDHTGRCTHHLRTLLTLVLPSVEAYSSVDREIL